MIRTAALALTATLVGASQSAWAQCVGLPGCLLVWSDEFDGTEVDRSKWSFQLGDGTEVGLPPGWGNNELQFYRAENARVEDGFLILTAREESFGGRRYTSARLRSLGRGDWTFGRMEMRARMPIGRGLWPAFWMLPSNAIYGTWAAGGEIDIVEYVGSEPARILATLHYGGPWPRNVHSTTAYFLPVETFHDDFHVFAVEWEHGEIRWYVDDTLFATRTSWFSTGGPYPAPFDVDFHLLLNLAVGGNLPGSPDALTSFPQELVVDYVRVYQVPPPVAITSPAAGDAIEPGDDLTLRARVDDPSSVRLVQFLQGVAYEDTHANNNGGAYRPAEGVDLERPANRTTPRHRRRTGVPSLSSPRCGKPGSVQAARSRSQPTEIAGRGSGPVDRTYPSINGEAHDGQKRLPPGAHAPHLGQREDSLMEAGL